MGGKAIARRERWESGEAPRADETEGAMICRCKPCGAAFVAEKAVSMGACSEKRGILCRFEGLSRRFAVCAGGRRAQDVRCGECRVGESD